MGAVNFYFYDRRTNFLEGNKLLIFQYSLNIGGGADIHAFSLNRQLTVLFTPAQGNTQLERTAINFIEVGI
jgi:hypothetical protein